MHGLDFSKGRAAMAFAGDKLPWHGFGESQPDGVTWTLEEWLKQAGADFDVVKVPSQYEFPIGSGQMRTAKDRFQLVRDDTGDSLSEMSKDYRVHQPKELFEFFRSITDETGEFFMKTAGVLHGGKKLWALAERKDGGLAVGEGVIKPYLLLCGSFDGTMASTGRFTTVEVVCQNTLSMSAQDKGTQAKQKHSSDFNIEKMAIDLSVFDSTFVRHVELLQEMAKLKMNEQMVTRFFAKLYASEVFEDVDKWQTCPVNQDGLSTNKSNTIAGLLETYEDNLGHALTGNSGTLWGALRTVTFHHDHLARTKEGKRWESATIGAGNRKKDEALELALELVS
jgi:phage/plasmid-like protein (TIGR03299 family)